MHRIDASGHSSNMFQAATDPKTQVDADWANAVQEEIVAVILDEGITLEKGTNTQLLAAITSKIAAAVSGIVGVPSGAVAHFAMAAAPAGWLKCDGSAVSRATYAGLFTAIGVTFGAGDGSTTFNLPDLRGEFLRGLDDGRGVDAGRALGSAQADAFKSHTHSFTGGSNNSFTTQWMSTAAINEGTTKTTSATGGTETRPRNVALLACIKT